MASRNNDTLRILSLPKLSESGLNRYPLYFTDINGNGPNQINVPVGCLTCRASCYTDINDVVVEGNSDRCRRCDQKIEPGSRFIDVGLMNLLTKYHTEIQATKPYYLEYDGQTSDLRFIKRKEDLEGRLAGVAADHIMEEMKKHLKDNNQEKVELNYPSIKGLFSDRIDKAIGDFKPQLITWCRGRLHLDEGFSALNLNFSSSPNKVLCFQLMDTQGKVLTLDYKNTHIHYFPKWRIFVLLVLEGQSPDRRLGIKVIDINSISLGNQRLIVTPTGSNIEGRVWYATSVDFSTNVLYVVGGLDNTGYTSNRIINLKIHDWIAKENRLAYQQMQPIVFDALQVTSVVPSLFLPGDDSANLAVIGGVAASVALRFETFKFEPRACFIDTVTKDKVPVLSNLSKYFGAYTHVIEIPQIVAKELRYKIQSGQKVIQSGPMLLIFGGTDDYIVDSPAKRQVFGKPYIYCPAYSMIELRTEIYAAGSDRPALTPLSNKLYPYLNDNSSSFVIEEVITGDRVEEKLVMRMLIPKRNSILEKEYESAYMLELVLERDINSSVVREYEIQCKLDS